MAEAVQNGGAEQGGSMAVSFSAVKPQLFVEAPKASDAVQFYKAAFGAEEVSRTMHSKRKAEQELPLVRYAELKIGCSSIIVSDLMDDASAPVKTGGTGCKFCLETDDVKAAVEKALNAGAVSEGELAGGEEARCDGIVGKVKDPYGFVWMICSSAKKCADKGAVSEGELAGGEEARCDGIVGKVKDPYGFVWMICSSAKKCADKEA